MRLTTGTDDPLGLSVASPLGEYLPRDVVEVALQTALRGVIHGFLHQPALAYWYRHAWTGESEPLAYHEVLARLLPRFDGVSSNEIATLSREPRQSELPAWVALLYRLSCRLIPPAEAPQRLAPSPQGVLSCKLPGPVRRLAAEMRRHRGLQLVLHGSLATCDATQYSDVDILLFIADEWLETGERSAALRDIVSRAQRWLYRYDPLQHHGFMIVSQFDLARYAHTYFPLELLKYAYQLGQPSAISYRLRRAENGNLARLHRLWARLEKYDGGGGACPETQYALKLMLSELMLLPTFYLQAKGQVLYKRESFDAVRSVLSPTAIGAMDRLSAWRREWKRGSWATAYHLIGSWLPGPISSRLLARVRMVRVSRRERERWSALVSGAKALCAELTRAASVGA